MLTPWKKLAKLLLWPVVFLSIGSGFPGCGQSVYGMPAVTYDPQVKVQDFSYAPARRAKPGEALTFTVTLDRAIRLGHIARPGVSIGDNEHRVTGAQYPTLAVEVNDSGITPDFIAGDNIWTGSYAIPGGLPPQTGLPVFAYYGEWKRGALDLEILPED